MPKELNITLSFDEAIRVLVLVEDDLNHCVGLRARVEDVFCLRILKERKADCESVIEKIKRGLA